MNTPHKRDVSAIDGEGRRRTARALVPVLLALLPACVDVDGGAVELSWSLRTPDGNANSCEAADIEQVRICWAEAEQDVSLCPNFRAFDCREERGFSRFEILPGETSFVVEPLCAGGTAPDPLTFEVPSPLLRQVDSGRVVTLGALLIIATDNQRGCRTGFCTCRDTPSQQSAGE